jgi:hypothetical protein
METLVDDVFLTKNIRSRMFLLTLKRMEGGGNTTIYKVGLSLTRPGGGGVYIFYVITGHHKILTPQYVQNWIISYVPSISDFRDKESSYSKRG